MGSSRPKVNRRKIGCNRVIARNVGHVRKVTHRSRQSSCIKAVATMRVRLGAAGCVIGRVVALNLSAPFRLSE